MLCRLIAASLLSVTAFAADARAEVLNFLIWENYLSPRVVEAWTRESGTTLNQIYFDSGEARDRIVADGKSDIDLAVLNENSVRIFRRKDLLLPVTDRTVPAVANSLPRWRERCSGFGMPYLWGTLGIVYRADRLATAPASWADLLRPAPELAGHVAMIGGFDDLPTPALILAGKSINSQAETDLKAAYGILKAQAPAVLTYDYVLTSAQNEKVGPDIAMALGYSGDQFALRRMDGHDWRYVLPREGSVLWVDCIGALSSSSRSALALRFLDFLNRPEIAAMNAADLSMPTANAAAVPLMPEAMRSDPQIFPPRSVIDASAFYEENSAKTVQVRKRMVDALVNFHDAH